MEMKEKIIEVIEMIIVVIGVVLMFSPLLLKTDTIHSEEYPQTMVVVHINEYIDSVTIETATGYQYSFWGIEDYQIGDVVSVTMNDNATENDITDDKIVEVRFSGYTREEVK